MKKWKKKKRKKKKGTSFLIEGTILNEKTGKYEQIRYKVRCPASY